MAHPRDTLNPPRRTGGPDRSTPFSPTTRFLATAVALLAMACAGDSSVDPVEVRNLSLAVEPTKLFLAEGQDGQLHARLVDDTGVPVAANDLSWTSSDSLVATVTDAGVVTGLASGVVTITASSKGKKKGANVNVRGKGKLEIHLSSGSGQSGPVGETLDQALVVEVRDRTGAGVPGVDVDWQATGGDGSPSAPTTTTNQNGLTQILWTLGPVLGDQTVQAKVNGAGTVDFQATGTPGAPASVTVSPDDVSMDVGNKQQFTAVVADQFGHPVEAGSIIWVSTAGDILYVDDTGVATGMSPGSAVIEAYAETVSGGANVDVTGVETAPEVSTVAVSPEAHTFTALGQTLQLEGAAFDGSGAPVTGITFNWSSSDPTIATVDDMGLVLAKAVGTVSMIVSAVCCDGATDTTSLAITQVPAAVEVSPATFVLKVDQTATLDAEVRDAEGNPMAYDPSWTSSDTLVATVDEQGLVTALTAGLVTIQAQAGDASGATHGEIADADLASEAPATVTDLAHAGESILAWTQVDDGTGAPADYAIRHSCPTISWGSAYDTEVAVSGTAVGERLEYDTNQVSGSCEYQLLAYRGELNAGAVFGSLSGKVAITIEAEPVPAAIEVSPASFSLDVGQSQQLNATVLGSDGAVMEGEEVTWSSTTPTVASITTGGLVSALAEGSAQFEARLASSPSSASSSNYPPAEVQSGPSAWSNGSSASSSSELVGVSSGTMEATEDDGGDTGGGSSDGLLFSDGFESGDSGSSGNGFFWATSGGNVNVTHRTMMQDGAAPRSSDHALEIYYKGPTDNINAEQRFHLGDDYGEIWLEYWLYVPSNFYHRDDPTGPDNNKFFMLWTDNHSSGKFSLTFAYNRQSGGESRLERFLSESHHADGSNNWPVGTPGASDFITHNGNKLRIGEWNRVRIYFKSASAAGVNDGRAEIWTNSTLANSLDWSFWADGNEPATVASGYLMGAANSGWSEDTYFYVDDFKVWRSDPGWN